MGQQCQGNSKNREQKYFSYQKAFVFVCCCVMCNKSSNKQLVGNKVKGRISKRVLQEHKVRQISRKTNISYSLTRTRKCAYEGGRG